MVISSTPAADVLAAHAAPALARHRASVCSASEFSYRTCPPATRRAIGWARCGELEGAGAESAESGNDGQHAAESENAAPARPEPFGTAPARPETTPVTGPRRYGVQFSAPEEYMQLVERAKALLSHVHSKSSLEEIQLRAMRLLVADLKKRRFAASARPRKATERAAKTESDASEATKSRGARQRGRHIPAAVRREVFERDAARCTFVDGAGQRCREKHCLELHHLLAFARGGEHQPSNLTLRCRAHNALAAEQDFGRELVELKRGLRHEPFRAWFSA